jgi:chromate transporter
MEKKVSLIDLFLVCVKVGLILLGGGYVILPILQSEMVEKRNWITEEELLEYYALSQSLPGIIAINVSIFIGYKLRGKTGAVLSMIGLIFSAFWIIVGLASILASLTSNTYIKGVLWGVEVAVIILIIASIKEMWEKAMGSKFSYIIYIFALCIMLFTKISPAIAIITTVIFGILCKKLTDRGEKNVDNS